MSTPVKSKVSIRGWKVTLNSDGTVALSKATSFGGSQSAVTFPATGSGAAGAVTLDDMRDLALHLLEECT
jgi:hypothetical protein